MESEAAKIGIQIVEGSLEDKPPTIWKMEKQGWKEAEKSKEEERRSEKRKSQKKEDPGGQKGRKVENTLFFPMFCGSGGSKSRLTKASGVEPSGKIRDQKIARRCGGKRILSHFEIRMSKTPHVRLQLQLHLHHVTLPYTALHYNYNYSYS